MESEPDAATSRPAENSKEIAPEPWRQGCDARPRGFGLGPRQSRLKGSRNIEKLIRFFAGTTDCRPDQTIPRSPKNLLTIVKQHQTGRETTPDGNRETTPDGRRAAEIRFM